MEILPGKAMAPRKEEVIPLRALVRDQGDRLDEYGKKIDEMYFAMMGNDNAGVDGLSQKVKGMHAYVQACKEEGIISRVQAHSKYIQKDKKFKWVLSGAAGTINIGFWAWLKNHFGG